MTGYKKRRMNAKGKSEWFVYKEFGNEGLLAEETYNCDCRTGVKPALLYKPFRFLDDGGGVQGTMLRRNDAKKLYYFRYGGVDGEQTENEALFFLSNGGNLYRQRPNQSFVELKASLGKDGAAVLLFNREGGRGSLFVGEGMAWHDFEKDTPMDLDCVVAVCAYKGRAFIGLAGSRILFSEPDAPWAFDVSDGNSYIDLTAAQGEITNFVVWNEKIYVFLEYGIFCLTPSGDMSESRLAKLPYGGGKTFCSSAGVCGEKIYFLAEDGVYAFNGKIAEKVCNDLPVYPSKSGQCAFAVKDSRFLLSYKDEKKGSTTLIIFDGKTPTACFADGFKSLGGDGAKTLFTVLEDNTDYLKILATRGEVYGDSFFKSEKLDFGKRGRKTLKKLLFRGRGLLFCRIYTENRIIDRIVNMGSTESEREINVFERGDAFCLEFLFTNDAEISSVAAEVAFAK